MSHYLKQEAGPEDHTKTLKVPVTKQKDGESNILKQRDWADCHHRRTDYFLTQFLTRYGSFEIFKKTPNCPYCENNDSPQHTVFNCEKWARERTALELDIGTHIAPDNIINTIISSKRNWKKPRLCEGGPLNKGARRQGQTVARARSGRGQAKASKRSSALDPDINQLVLVGVAPDTT
ncbi:hypothetical protein JTB14_013677 [Gonioctena quinquepunctata]|nr:hypothetical protein JTB14_013677 [Gonioctena quinquepunctata]